MEEEIKKILAEIKQAKAENYRDNKSEMDRSGENVHLIWKIEKALENLVK